MFLSGNYRRQRIMQAANQQDYFDRKMFWRHPYGINITSYLPMCLESDRFLGVTAEEVREQGAKSITTTQDSFKVIYARVPQDFGKDSSKAVDAINHEEEEWLNFLSKVLTYSSDKFKLPVMEVPILTPHTIAEAKRTTLAEIISSRKHAPAN